MPKSLQERRSLQFEAASRPCNSEKESSHRSIATDWSLTAGKGNAMG